jgi:hypothetical protein
LAAKGRDACDREDRGNASLLGDRLDRRRLAQLQKWMQERTQPRFDVREWYSDRRAAIGALRSTSGGCEP